MHATPQRWVIGLTIGVAVIILGVVLYLNAIAPRIEVIDNSAKWYGTTQVEMRVIVKNSGHVPVSVILLYEVKFPSNSSAFTKEVEMTLDIGEEKVVVAYIDIPSGYYPENGIAYVYVENIREWDLS